MTNDNPTCTNCKYFDTANSNVDWEAECTIKLPAWVAHVKYSDHVVRADDNCDLFQRRAEDREIPQHVPV